MTEEQIERLRYGAETAMYHSLREWKNNGSKQDDQFGIVALLLAHALGMTDEKPRLKEEKE